MKIMIHANNCDGTDFKMGGGGGGGRVSATLPEISEWILHDAICLTNSFVITPGHCVNF